jgi:hypothetical protein
MSQCLLAACFLLVSYLSHSSALKIDAVCSSKTQVGFHWTTMSYPRRYYASQTLVAWLILNIEDGDNVFL